MLIDFASMVEIVPQIAEYVPVTLGLTLASMLLACLLGLLATIARNAKIPVLSQIAHLYVLLGRALPPMIVLYVVFFGLPILLMISTGSDEHTKLMASINPCVYAIIGLGLHAGAYMAEIFRSALSSVGKGQMEAALSAGLSYRTAFFRIILPQAAVYAMPMIGNQCLNVFKGTSIACMITVVEMFGEANIITSLNNLYLEVYLTVSAMYWGISIVLERVFLLLEKRVAYYKAV